MWSVKAESVVLDAAPRNLSWSFHGQVRPRIPRPPPLRGRLWRCRRARSGPRSGPRRVGRSACCCPGRLGRARCSACCRSRPRLVGEGEVVFLLHAVCARREPLGCAMRVDPRTNAWGRVAD